MIGNKETYSREYRDKWNKNIGKKEFSEALAAIRDNRVCDMHFVMDKVLNKIWKFICSNPTRSDLHEVYITVSTYSRPRSKNAKNKKYAGNRDYKERYKGILFIINAVMEKTRN